MLPKKAIIAIIIVSLLLIGYEGLSGGEQAKKAPNLLLGFALVGAFNAIQSVKEMVHPI